MNKDESAVVQGTAVRGRKKASTSPQSANTALKRENAHGRTKDPKEAPKGPEKVSGDGSKTARVLDLLKRKGGVTSAELMEATGWRAHSVRGFLSGAVRKRLGLTVVSTKNDGGSSTYSIES